jgi:hydrophobe/amphiphile efflux-1 (HAE1) family protein
MANSSSSISTLAIRRHIATLMLAIAVVVLGFFTVTRLPVDLLPSITYPRIGVRLDAPGISPEVAVDEITRPLEQALAATDGVAQVFSQTREGRISIDLFFQPGGDIDQALNDATATLNRARSNLPDAVGQPRLFKFDPSQLPVYEFALTSETLQGVDLRVFADEELARELNTIPGVASVDVSGGVQEEVRVNLDLRRMQAMGVGLTDVLDELRDRNLDTSGGIVQGQETEVLTRTMGRFQTAEEIRNLRLETGGTSGQQIYLRDVAEVIDGTEEQRIFVFLNGNPAVKVSVQKQPDANTVTVVEAVKAKLDALQAVGLFPDDVVMTATLDESRFIRNSIQTVAIAGLTGATLAAIAVLFFLGSLRQTLIIVLAIPMAILVAMILMGIFGLSLNVFSLGGLALGVGIVVDNSIVMLENIARSPAANRLPQLDTDPVPGGNDLKQQTAQRSQELESALVASTSTNLVAVLPFLLIGGFISLLFNELILTISFAVAASLVVALTVVPTLASQLLEIRGTSGIGQWWLLAEFRLRLEGLTRQYREFLTWVLRHRIWAIALSVLLLGGSSLWMAGQIPQEILPSIDTGQARLWAQFPPGTTLEENRRVMAAVDERLLAQPDTAYTFTTSGGGLFGSSTSENVLRGSSTITLKPGAKVGPFIGRMNQDLAQLNLVSTRLRLSPESVRGLILSNSPVRGAEIDLVLQGANADALQQAGRQVLAALDQQATLASFRPDGEQPRPEVQIRPDWERSAALGLTAQEIGETVQTALDGSVPTQLQRGDRLVDVRLKLTEDSVQRPEQLLQLPLFADGLPTADGQSPATRQPLVRLGDVARIELGQAPGEIQRINQRQVFIIAGSLTEGANLSDALAETDRILADVQLPEGVTFLPSANAETNRQIQQALLTLGGLASFLVFVVMAVQYNSLIDPLVIMLTVPLALAGGILGLFITQTAIGATVIVGAVLLVGIVVNNAIIMVELANQIRDQQQVNHLTAILQAAPQRLRPILMTTVTTVLGLFPLALGIGEGSEFLQPLGIVVFSGLSLATLLTLFIIPCFYTLLHDPRWHQWLRSPGKRRSELAPMNGKRRSPTSSRNFHLPQ